MQYLLATFPDICLLCSTGQALPGLGHRQCLCFPWDTDTIAHLLLDLVTHVLAAVAGALEWVEDTTLHWGP